MNTQEYPLDVAPSSSKRPSSRSTAILLRKLMEQPANHKTPALGNDTAWALKLKTCVDVVARDLHVEVLSAKPVQCFELTDSRDMLFEVLTNRGRLEVIRERSGVHSYIWRAAEAWLA